MNREEQKQTIKDYLKRLGAGEELESVRVDFVKKFQSVDAAEIMNAEQELIKEGTPISEVQRLCDVHSALFHGKTREAILQITKGKESSRYETVKINSSRSINELHHYPLLLLQGRTAQCRMRHRAGIHTCRQQDFIELIVY